MLLSATSWTRKRNCCELLEMALRLKSLCGSRVSLTPQARAIDFKVLSDTASAVPYRACCSFTGLMKVWPPNLQAAEKKFGQIEKSFSLLWYIYSASSP
jgi:hypothetical protein